MKKFNDLLKEIGPLLAAKEINYQALIECADQLIYHLLSMKMLSRAQKNLLSELCFILHKYTGSMNSDKSQYAKDFQYNTCDYKIVRELVLRFKGNSPYQELRQWANYYYYDGILWGEAIDQMKEIDHIEALVYAIKHTQPYPDTTEERLREGYWRELKTLEPTWKEIEGIVINTMMPIDFVKKEFEYVFEKGLLKGLPEEEYYTYLWEKTFRNVASMEEHIEITEKERPKLQEIAGKISKE